MTAKILSVLCDYPMLILGYSMEDPDVKGILDDLVTSLDDDKLRQLEKNIVYVSYTPGLNEYRHSEFKVEHEGHRMTIRSVETDNFEGVFREIVSMEPSTSPMFIRKIRQLVKRVSIDRTSNEHCGLLGIDSITDEDVDKLVIAVTTLEGMRALKSIPIYTVDNMVKDIMNDVSEYDPKAVVNYFLKAGKSAFNINQYVPIFYFIEKSGFGLDEDSPFMRQFIQTKNNQFRNKLSLKLPTPCTTRTVETYDNVVDVLSKVGGYMIPTVIMHYFDDGTLSKAETMGLLRKLYNEFALKNQPYRSNFLCALTYVSFKELGLDQKVGH